MHQRFCERTHDSRFSIRYRRRVKFVTASAARVTGSRSFRVNNQRGEKAGRARSWFRNHGSLTCGN